MLELVVAVDETEVKALELLEETFCFSVGLDFPTSAKGLACVGDGLNFLTVVAGEEGLEPTFGCVSVGFMLTETGFESASCCGCLGGNLSGGPIGLSSRFRFLFFSSRPLSSLLGLLFRSRRSSLLIDFIDGFAIGVIVMELGNVVCGVDDIGIISMPGRRSRPMPVNTEL